MTGDDTEAGCGRRHWRCSRAPSACIARCFAQADDRAAGLGAAGRHAGDRRGSAHLHRLARRRRGQVDARSKAATYHSGRRVLPPQLRTAVIHRWSFRKAGSNGAFRSARALRRIARTASDGCLLISLRKAVEGVAHDHFARRAAAARPIAPRQPAPLHPADGLIIVTGARRRAVPGDGVPDHSSASRVRSRPPSRRCAKSARSACCMQREVEVAEPPHRPPSRRHGRQHAALRHRARRRPSSGRSRACSDFGSTEFVSERPSSSRRGAIDEPETHTPKSRRASET